MDRAVRAASGRVEWIAQYAVPALAMIAGYAMDDAPLSLLLSASVCALFIIFRWDARVPLASGALAMLLAIPLYSRKSGPADGIALQACLMIACGVLAAAIGLLANLHGKKALRRMRGR